MKATLALFGAAAALAFVPAASSASMAAPNCGDVLTSSVALSGNLVCSGDGLTIAATVDITLDLHGYSLTGSGAGTGITVTAASAKVTIKNGTVRGFAAGIFLDASSSFGTAQLEHLIVRENGTGVAGFGNGGSLNTTLADSTISNNRDVGVSVAFISFRMLRDRVNENEGDGISAFEDSLALLQDSSVSRNAGMGLNLSDSVARITGNTFRANGSTGLSLQERVCDFVRLYVVADNTAIGNAAGGMIMTPTSQTCSPPNPLPPPPAGSGNVARENVGFQCVFIVCKSNS